MNIQSISPSNAISWSGPRSLLTSFVALMLVSSSLYAAEIEEIVVTARKQDESLLEVPVAVSVVTAEFFEKSGFNTMSEVVKFVPGFDYSPTNTTRAQGTKIRGISTFSFSDGLESSVATVIDGVVMGREAQGFFDLYDIESVEVIKGPQGTLFGKNASAGVVNVRTKKPEFEFSAGGDAMLGTYDEMRFRGTVTGPMIEDKLAFRLTGSTHQRDGMIDNALSGQKDINDKGLWSVRGKLLYTPSEKLSALLTVDYTDEDTACCLGTYRVAGPPSGLLGFALNPGGNIQLQDALDAAGIVAGPGNRTVAIEYDRIGQVSDATGVALEINYDWNDALFTSISSWRDWNIDEFNEADQLEIASINNQNGGKSDTQQMSQEFRLSGNIGESTNYVVGLFYFKENLFAEGRVFVELALPFPPTFNALTRSPRSVNTTAFAAFGEFTFDISERFSVVVGGRFTDEEKEGTFSRIATPIDPNLPFAGNFGVDWSGRQTVDDTNFSGRIIGRYSISDSANAYLTWSRGYKGAGLDVAASAQPTRVSQPGGLTVLKPEEPTLIELGYKGRFLDNTLSLNTALFHQSLKNVQTLTATPDGFDNVSIGEVLSEGIEADITYLPPGVDGLTLTGSLAWMDVVYEKYAERPDLEGKPYQDVPEWAFSLIADYGFEFGEGGWDSFVRAEYTWQDDKNTSSDGTSGDRDIDAYGLLNLRAGATSPSGIYSVNLSVENATDEDYPFWIGGSTYTVLDGVTTVQYLGPDRVVRLSLGAQFE